MEVLNEEKLKLRNFLLGKSNVEEAEQIGTQIIADERFGVELPIAENALIEDFLEKNLSAEDEKLFCENFLISEERRENLHEIFRFKQYAARNFPQTARIVEQPKSFGEKLREIFSLKTGWAIPALTVLTVVFALGLFWLLRSGDTAQMSPLEKEFAALNAQDLGNRTDLKNVNLISETFRNTNSGNKLKASEFSDKVLFKLGLPFQLSENERLKMELRKDENTIFKQTEIRIYKNQSGQEVRVLLPKSVLEKGQYKIVLENPKDKNSPLNFGFSVE